MGRCPVEGCSRQLDEFGRPVEFCEYQQGACPQQKLRLALWMELAITLAFMGLFGVIWYLNT
jgi:hypothetical protein